MRTLLKLFLLPSLVMMTLFSCSKTDSAAIEDSVDEALYSVQERGGMGKYGCYELVFPVSFTLPDASVVEANSYEDIKAALRTYFSNNGGQGHGNGHGLGKRLNFVFPISVLSQSGEVITVDDQAGLLALRADCPGTFGNHDHHGHGQHGVSCFEVVFPITISFPDSTTAEVADLLAFRQAIRIWRANNPGNTERPEIVFPITIKMTEDGSIVTVASREELKTIKDNCE